MEFIAFMSVLFLFLSLLLFLFFLVGAKHREKEMMETALNALQETAIDAMQEALAFLAANVRSTVVISKQPQAPNNGEFPGDDNDDNFSIS